MTKQMGEGEREGKESNRERESRRESEREREREREQCYICIAYLSSRFQHLVFHLAPPIIKAISTMDMKESIRSISTTKNINTRSTSIRNINTRTR